MPSSLVPADHHPDFMESDLRQRLHKIVTALFPRQLAQQRPPANQNAHEPRRTTARRSGFPNTEAPFRSLACPWPVVSFFLIKTKRWGNACKVRVLILVHEFIFLSSHSSPLSSQPSCLLLRFAKAFIFIGITHLLIHIQGLKSSMNKAERGVCSAFSINGLPLPTGHFKGQLFMLDFGVPRSLNRPLFYFLILCLIRVPRFDLRSWGWEEGGLLSQPILSAQERRTRMAAVWFSWSRSTAFSQS